MESLELLNLQLEEQNRRLNKARVLLDEAIKKALLTMKGEDSKPVQNVAIQVWTKCPTSGKERLLNEYRWPDRFLREVQVDGGVIRIDVDLDYLELEEEANFGQLE